MAKETTFAYKGSTALITGASGGLGEAFAEELANRGSDLVLVGRSEQKLQALARRLERQRNITTTVLTADLASSSDVDQLISNLKIRRIHVDLLGKRVLVPGKLSVRLMALTPRLFPRALMAQFGESVVRKLNHV